jgi:hypothetical protein
MAQDEIYLPEDFSKQRVHIFFDYPHGLVFGGIIPKGVTPLSHWAKTCLDRSAFWGKVVA